MEHEKKIEEICAKDIRFKAIFNTRNFGPVRSPIYNLYNANGNAVIVLCADLQDPPELIPEFLKKWEEGYKLVMGVRTGSEEKGLMPLLRKLYYTSLKKISEVEQLPGVTGFGLYDRDVIKILRTINDPYPYLRGLICELGWPIAKIPFLDLNVNMGYPHIISFVTWKKECLALSHNHEYLYIFLLLSVFV